MARKDYDDTLLEHYEDLYRHAGFESFMKWVSGQLDDLCRQLEAERPESSTASIRGEIRALRRIEGGLAHLIEQRKAEIDSDKEAHKIRRGFKAV